MIFRRCLRILDILRKSLLNILNGDYNFDLLYYSYPLGYSIKVVNIKHVYTQFSSALSSGLWIIMYSVFHPIFFWHLCKINVYERLNYNWIELNWVSFCFIMTLSAADPVQLTSSIVFLVFLVFFGLLTFLHFKFSFAPADGYDDFCRRLAVSAQVIVVSAE